MRSLLSLRRFFGTKKYAKSHEWFEFFPEKKIGRLGISDHAQEQLGEIVHVEFPQVGKKFETGQAALVIESVKMAADVYTPISGQIVAVNSELEKTPTLINEKAEETWLFEIQCDKEPDNLLSLEDYKSTL